MQRLLALLLSAAPTLALCSVAAAAEPVRPGSPDARAMFQRLAASQGGEVKLDELPDAVPEFVKRMLQRADTNEDGVVTAEEFAAVAQFRPGQGPPGGPPAREPQRAADAAPRERDQPARGRAPEARSPGRPAEEATRRGPEASESRRPEAGESRPSARESRPAADARPAPARAPEARPRGPAAPPSSREARPRGDQRRPETAEPWSDPEALFRRFDRDGDGQLSLREFTAALRTLQQRMAPRRDEAARDRRDPRRAPGPPAARMQPPRRGAPGPQAPWMQPPRRGAPGPQAPWMQAPRRGAPWARAPWSQPPRREAAAPSRRGVSDARRGVGADDAVRQALRELAAERRAELAERIEAIRQRARAATPEAEAEQAEERPADAAEEGPAPESARRREAAKAKPKTRSPQ